MESPTQLARDFMGEAKKLFEFFGQINEYIGQTTGRAPPVPPATLTILLIAINAGSVEAAGHVCDTFAERAVPQVDTIRARNSAAFAKLAPDLFPEVPRHILEQICDLVRNDDPDFAETKDDIFAYVDCLFDLAIRRQIALGSSTKVPRSSLAEVARKIETLSPAYTRALAAP